MRTKVVINSVINSWVMRRQRKRNRRGLVICAIDKNDSGLTFTSCLELKPPGNFPQWHQQEHGIEGVKAVRTHRAQHYAEQLVRCLWEGLGLQLPI